MKHLYKITAFILVLVICTPALFSCAKLTNPTREPVELWGESSGLDELDRVSTKTAPAPVIPNYNGADILRAGVDDISCTPSPFFSKSEGELYVNSLTQLKLLPYERGGRVVTSGIDGEAFSYRGEEHIYYSIADVDVRMADDGRAVYSFSLREDVFFSDGTNLTADDVIFSMYVLLDPSYDGYSNLANLPISGLDLYRKDMLTMYEYVSTKSSGRYYTEQEVADFTEKRDAAGEKYASDVIEYNIKNYGTETFYKSEYGGKWGTDIAENEGLRSAYVMVVCGLAEWDKNDDGTFAGSLTDIKGKTYNCTEIYPTAGDIWACMVSDTVSFEDVSYTYSSEKELLEYIKEGFGEEYDYYFEVKRQGDGTASSVSGIKKTGMYSFTVTLDKYDATAIYAFSFYIAPLHIYGSRTEYKYTENKFGFTKGDLRSIEERGLLPVGGGAYTYRSASEGALSFERNTYYCFGCPYVKNIELILGTSEDIALDIKEGKYDIAADELTAKLSSSLLSEEYKDIVAYYNINRDGYGYIGINAQKVNAGASDSEASKMLRTAFCILFDVYKTESVYYYYGERASEIDYPLDPNSWAYPNDAQGAFSKRADGADIYGADMTEKQKYEAALDAALEYFIAAGYEYNEKTKKLTAAPEGGSLEYEFLICDGQKEDHPCYRAVKLSADALRSIGVSLKIASVASAEELEARLCRGDVQMWTYAWEFSQDPDMYQVYYSKNIPTLATGTASNYFFIADKTLDSAISEARKSMDSDKRAEIYKQCFDIVAEWGVEVPMYVKHSAFMYNASKMASDYKPVGMSEYYSWADEAYKIKLS